MTDKIIPSVSSPSSGTSRRQFLRASALATASLGFPAILRAQNLNSKLNIVVIGCGGRGAGNLGEVAAGGDNIVA
ncbi:MAG TPA: twin-arginine translocation signal domain-containing protein, partial [Verrucomicrobiales bacterium]|nr:twin-arginine translocation signal domain-containing protein [Verrucomicrobiales bacterium]